MVRVRIQSEDDPVPIQGIASVEFDADRAMVAGLRDSALLEDRIVAILMDDAIGSCGFWEPYSRIKAKHIMEVINGPVQRIPDQIDQTDSGSSNAGSIIV
jgi:hypothetical protein